MKHFFPYFLRASQGQDWTCKSANVVLIPATIKCYITRPTKKEKGLNCTCVHKAGTILVVKTGPTRAVVAVEILACFEARVTQSLPCCATRPNMFHVALINLPESVCKCH